uniref:Centriolar coiled-coil protein 110 n=1 Tax=Sander lucioperca TaxID=283035 RepID=A0A8C9XY30_SANLU
MADWGETLSGAVKSPDHWGSVGSESGGGASRSGDRRSSHCGTSPVQETCSPGSASGLSPKGHHDHLAAGFRRRCHTLDSQLHSYHSGVEHIDRSQERVPRFMAGVTWKAPSWRTPAAPLNQSYEVDIPSPSLLRPRMSPDMAQVTLKMEPDDTQGTNNGRITPTVLSRNAAEAQASKTGESLLYLLKSTEALEDMQRRLEEEHVLQMSLLLAEQEKEQQRLRLELEETERRLREQGGVRPLSGDVCGWNCRSVSDSRPVVSPSCPGLSPAHTPSERSPGHSKGTASTHGPLFLKPSLCFSLHIPIFLCTCRVLQVLTSQQQRAFCRIGAIIRGFLTRRLLKTEKVRHLRQTITDTQEFIRSFQTEAPQKRGLCSAEDRSLQGRVRAQLRAALYDIHDIFFEMPLGGRLALLQQERELRAERKLREMKTLKRKSRLLFTLSMNLKTNLSLILVLKPSQGQHSPVPGQLNRQGSVYTCFTIIAKCLILLS